MRLLVLPVLIALCSAPDGVAVDASFTLARLVDNDEMLQAAAGEDLDAIAKLAQQLRTLDRCGQDRKREVSGCNDLSSLLFPTLLSSTIPLPSGHLHGHCGHLQSQGAVSQAGHGMSAAAGHCGGDGA